MTYEAITHLAMNSATNASRAGGQTNFTVYVIIWPHLRGNGLIKAGYTAHDYRWRGFLSHHNGIAFSFTAFPTEKLARAYEATWLALLDFISYQAFTSGEEARAEFGRSDGWTEIYRMPDVRQLASYIPPAFGGIRYWEPEKAFAVMRDRSAIAYRQTREAFGDAIRAKRYRNALGGSA